MSKRREADHRQLGTVDHRSQPLPEILTNSLPDDNSFTETMLDTSLQSSPLYAADLFVGSLYDHLDEANSFENLLFLSNYDLNAF